ncbi:MAG: 50S ribosomal protein L18 [uncultured bacterium]|nr:MAG: 50S ribosomal protein L18 [uncultured bacterium]HLD45224.1 50S ribosomal protein L18 [bacterium]
MATKKLTPRQKRQVRIRKKISGAPEKPRLTVFRSNRYLYVQLIDDLNQQTLASASTIKEKSGCNKSAAANLGKEIAEKAVARKISTICFDRSGYRYHGVLKEIAEAARKAGLQF